MPFDSDQLRQALALCLPSLVIDAVASPSGQRVVYFGHFDDALIPQDASEGASFLNGWERWGPIVVKVVSGIDAQSLTYLQREIEVLSELNSPNYPRLLFSEVFTQDPVTESPLPERLFVTIEERVQAKPLSELLGEYQSEAQIASLLENLCIALLPLWTHQKRLVHRDIKPANILIRADGTAVVIDLGILRETGEVGQTQTGQHGPMTPAYAAPEQVKGDKDAISYKSDFFALGVIAYQLACGNHPFGAGPAVAASTVLHNILTSEPPNLKDVCSHSPEFCSCIHRMLEKEPYQRHRTPHDLINAIVAIRDGSGS